MNLVRYSGGSRPSDKGGGVGGGKRSSRPSDKGVPGLRKKFVFRPFGPQFGLKIKGGNRAPRASPLDPPLR